MKIGSRTVGGWAVVHELVNRCKLCHVQVETHVVADGDKLIAILREGSGVLPLV